MDSVAASPALLASSPNLHRGSNVFNPSLLQKQSQVPENFIWPKEYLVGAIEELQVPLVDLDGFLNGDEQATLCAAKLIRAACLNHGFFQVINHGVDQNLIAEAYDQTKAFFKLPIERKLEVRKTAESMWGYSGAHADRFSSNLPWKETFSFPYHNNDSEPVVTNYFRSSLGEDFELPGKVFQKYCEAMQQLGLKVMELLGISLGVERLLFKDFFKDGCSIMRCNYYPPCQQPSLALGTGPHCDPTSLTILHQDQIGGLDVFADNKWQTVPPLPGALVFNIGDTFTALSNGNYKSCLHRVVVNRFKERASLSFFLCPKDDKVVRPPEDIIQKEAGTKQYPDFTWSQLLHYTQKHYRSDEDTLKNFTKWLLSSKQHTV